MNWMTEKSGAAELREIPHWVGGRAHQTRPVILMFQVRPWTDIYWKIWGARGRVEE